MNEWLKPAFISWLHRCNPVVKVFLFLLLFILTVNTHDIDHAAIQTAVYIVLLFTLSGWLPWRVLLLLLTFMFVFVSSALTMIMFGKGDVIWWEWGLIRVTEESFYRGVHLGFRAICFASQGLLLILTTSSVQLFYALMQKMKLPPKYAYAFMASIRLLPMVWEELLIRRQALMVRGISTGGGLRGLYSHMKMYAIPLLSQSIRRAHRMAVAMECKQFRSESRERTYYYSSPLSRYDLYIVFLFAGVLIAAYYLSLIYPIFDMGDVRYR